MKTNEFKERFLKNSIYQKKEHCINGKFLYYAFVSGANQILEHQSEINEINVFPVKDKDTGTNIASTVRSVIDNIKPYKSYKKTANNIAEMALTGARGNSGIIFAQFLYGANQETPNKKTISLPEFAESVYKSITYVYEAVENPVEGTMLTVIKDWAEFIHKQKNIGNEFDKIFIKSLAVLEKSLKETTTKLKVLNKTGLVDAGAKAFVLFIKGAVDFVKNRNIRKIVFSSTEKISLIHTEENPDEDIKYRFCTEAIIKNISQSKEELKNFLGKKGNSLVVAGSEKMCRIHIHTNSPAEIFQSLKKIGTITFQKVDDMLRQNEIATKRKWNIALVTDSSCDLPQELIDFYQIHMLPISLNFGENHYLDKVTILPNQFYDMLESEADFPKSSQINEQAFTNLYSHLASHYDAIIALHLSKNFSGTYANSLKAAQRISKEFNKEIHVFDSKNLSGALGLLVFKTAQNIEAGHSFEKITQEIERDIKQTKIFVSVKNLNAMIKGGRVSAHKGLIANILHLNPIVSMDENGKSLLFGKSFGQKSGIEKIYKHIAKISCDKKIWNYIVLHANNPEEADKIANKMTEMIGKKPVAIINISPVIGMHAGKGAVSISLLFDS